MRQPFIGILALSSLFGSSAVAQSPATQTVVPQNVLTMASPNAAALGKYGEIPVGLYTGVPSIGIPMYSLKLKKLEIPISLSYHAAGIRVDELAGDVGLGWSLNYGGSITAAVYGLPDAEHVNGWFFTHSQVPQTTYYQTSGWAPLSNWAGDSNYLAINNAMEGKLIDSQPDLFYLNFNGRSIKFFFDAQGNIRTMPYQAIAITGANGGFRVVDEQDVVYEFYTVEQTTTHSFGSPDNDGNISQIPDTKSYTYYLQKITTPQGEVVTYNYEDYSYTFDNQISETAYALQPGNTGATCGGDKPAGQIITSNSAVNGKRIKKISASTGIEINFIYGLARTDLNNTSALTAITVISTLDNVQKSRWDMGYGYNSGRLNLLSATHAGDGAHIFEYDGSLPVRLSKGQDHWGYANTSSYQPTTTTLPLYLEYGFTTGNNREADSHAKDGILKKITYPTGGYTIFDFENNTVGEQVSTTISHAASASGAAYVTVNVPFTVTNQVPNSVRAQYSAPEGGSVTDPQTGIAGICTVRIKDAAGTLITTFMGQSSNPLGDITVLPDGEYFIEIRTTVNYTGASLYLTWKEQGGATQLTNSLVGGLRINTITSYPLVGPATARHFVYTRSDNPAISSGWSRFKPAYVYTHIKDSGNGNGTFYECFYNAMSSSSATPLGTIQGGAVGYNEVMEYLQDKSMGYTYNRFSGNAGSSITGSVSFPYGPVIGNEWIEGLPMETKTFRWNAPTSTYTPVSKTVNEYKTTIGVGPNESFARGAKVSLQRPGIPNNVGGGPAPRSPEFAVHYYNLYSSWTYPTRTTETTYDPVDSTQRVVSSSAYMYDNPSHIGLTRQEITRSDGQLYTVSFRYPKDINANFAFLANPVVEKRVYVSSSAGNKLISSELTTFRNDAGAEPLSYHLYTPATPGTASMGAYDGVNVDAPYRPVMNYLYDSQHNIISITQPGINTVVYLWSYKGQYPVAEIRNAPYSVIQSILSQGKIDELRNLVNPDKAKIDEYLLAIKTQRPDLFIQSSSYSPFTGMLSQTDVTGITTYFSYDEFQRLQSVKDQNGNIIKANTYHFKP